ncbi:MAG: hypothetical protein F6K42_15280 [Leptolyngbya sp. SIO1D8]|nr:hypothetical protein [Leptolyngbya sp. SIO1D8]
MIDLSPYFAETPLDRGINNPAPVEPLYALSLWEYYYYLAFYTGYQTVHNHLILSDFPR